MDEDNSENYKVIKADLIEKAQKLIDFILFLFPKIPAKKMANIGPLLYVKKISKIKILKKYKAIFILHLYIYMIKITKISLNIIEI